ncbi:MAG: MMPL family transporter [Candidatus Marinimicrobia bacterium]|nr:MMPL family transporter [Candidatus Neomarinimicrobiota bacterium]
MALLVALNAIPTLFIGRLTVSNDLDIWFVDNDPALLEYFEFKNQFGSDELVVIAVYDTVAALSVGSILRLDKLSRALESIDGIERVLSLSNIPVPKMTGTGVTFQPLVTDSVGPYELALAEAAIQFNHQLIGRDGKTQILWAWMEDSPDLEANRDNILAATRQVVNKHILSGGQFAMAGGGVIYSALNQLTLSEGVKFISLAYFVVIAGLFILTRSVGWAIIALLAVTLTNLAMFGVMGMLGHQLNAVTSALPTLVMIIGVADIFHYASYAARHQAITTGTDDFPLSGVLVPASISTLTTMLAFSTLQLATMQVTRDLGLYAAIGVGFAFINSTILAAIYLLIKSRSHPNEPSAMNLRGDRVASISRWAFEHPRRVISVAVAVATISVVGALNLKVDTNTIDFIPQDHPVRMDDRLIYGQIGPYIPLEMIVGNGSRRPWKDPQFVALIEEISDSLIRDDNIGSVFGITRMLGGALRSIGIQQGGLDDPANQLAGLLSTFPQRDLERLVTNDEKGVRLTATIPLGSAANFVHRAEKIRAQVVRLGKGEIQVKLSGYLPLYNRMISNLVQDQVSSFLVAFLSVFVVLGLALRSSRLMLLSFAPNLLPVLFIFGVMGFASIPLDIVSVSIAPILLGIIVDDTLHFLYQFRHAKQSGSSTAEAVSGAGKIAGSAILATTMVLTAGFAILTFAGAKTIALVGLLSAVGIVVALGADLMLLPALLRLGYKSGGNQQAWRH